MRFKVLVSVLAVALVVCVGIAAVSVGLENNGMRLVVPQNWELEIGDSRSVDYVFNDDSVKNRTLSWSTSSEKVATVDKWGRVTAKDSGRVTVVAETSDGLKATAKLRVVTKSKANGVETRKIDYSGNAAALGTNLQKIVTRYATDIALDSENVPTIIKNAITSEDYSRMNSAVTADRAIWLITDYGVLRKDENAANLRDAEQRFMGDRYFFDKDTTTGKVLGIMSDGENGIWTITAGGVTHIEMVTLNGATKADMMVKDTRQYVMRHGFVAESYYNETTGEWKGNESDNDGLWTSMFAAGELMRYASLKKSATATKTEIDEARYSALISTEAVLLLSNITMRTGTVEAYVRYQPNGRYDENPYGNETANGRYQSGDALEAGGDGSLNIPAVSPAEAFEIAYEKYLEDGTRSYFLVDGYLEPFVADDWSNPITNEDGSVTYETRTRNLEGYIARTYSTEDENNLTDGYIHWQFEYDEGGNLVAKGVSTKTPDAKGYYLNGENLRGVTVDASGCIPVRLWGDLIAAKAIKEDTDFSEIVYKGDTSSDEIIGHLFLYKLAYDILGAEDPELKLIISNTMDKFAQHVSDNGYMMVDATGQPGTWSKFNRQFFYNSSQLGGAPLTASVCLCIFKVAYYVTGYQKWQNEYLMAALDPAYEYAKLTSQYSEQCYLYMMTLLDDYLAEYTSGLLTKDSLVRDLKLDLSPESALTSMLKRLFINYSDEEMAMLAFYILFQLETDQTLLGYYRNALNDWWESIQYSENPLWYYIYQLAYPNECIKDAYGNSLVETAAWSLSRHPIDTRKYCASNRERDDVYTLDLADLGLGEGTCLSYDISGDKEILPMTNIVQALTEALKYGPDLSWKVAAPDERALHKYNGATYRLETDYEPNCMEGSTTYTLPYWMGIYHGMLEG